MSGLDFARVYEKPESVEQLRALATGTNPLIVNVTPNSAVIGGERIPADRMVYAAQLPLKVGPEGLKKPLESSVAYAPLIRRNGVINVGYITPFADLLSPEATWYSISTLPAKIGQIKDKEAELNIMQDQAVGVAEALGLVPVDPEETLFKATAPGYANFRAPAADAPGNLRSEERLLCRTAGLLRGRNDQQRHRRLNCGRSDLKRRRSRTGGAGSDTQPEILQSGLVAGNQTHRDRRRLSHAIQRERSHDLAAHFFHAHLGESRLSLRASKAAQTIRSKRSTI